MFLFLPDQSDIRSDGDSREMLTLDTHVSSKRAQCCPKHTGPSWTGRGAATTVLFYGTNSFTIKTNDVFCKVKKSSG